MTCYRQDHRGPIAKLPPDDPLHRRKRTMDSHLETKSVLKSSPSLYSFTRFSVYSWSVASMGKKEPLSFDKSSCLPVNLKASQQHRFGAFFLGRKYLLAQINNAFTDSFNRCVNHRVGKTLRDLDFASFPSFLGGILSMTQCLGVLGKVFPERFFKNDNKHLWRKNDPLYPLSCLRFGGMCFCLST